MTDQDEIARDLASKLKATLDLGGVDQEVLTRNRAVVDQVVMASRNAGMGEMTIGASLMYEFIVTRRMDPFHALACVVALEGIE